LWEIGFRGEASNSGDWGPRRSIETQRAKNRPTGGGNARLAAGFERRPARALRLGLVGMDVYFVVIECPNTGKSTRTGIELSDMGAFSFVGLIPQRTSCQHCNEIHQWTQRDAWIERSQASRVHMRPPATTPPRDD
jgi:hypothetical protein